MSQGGRNHPDTYSNCKTGKPRGPRREKQALQAEYRKAIVDRMKDRDDGKRA